MSFRNNPYENPQDTLRWYAVEDRVHESIMSYLVKLETEQSYIAQNNLRNMRMYGNSESMRLNQYNPLSNGNSLPSSPRVTLNVIAPQCDTATSKICKNIPKPQFLTDEGDWSMQEKAKNLTKFIEGSFYGMNLKSKMIKSFSSSTILGTGAVYFYKEDGEVKSEFVNIDEIKIDDREAMFSAPRSMYRVRFIDKDVLKHMFPGNDVDIDRSITNDREAGIDRKDYSDNMVYVAEAWHLGSGSDKHLGRHVICTSTITLAEEDYKKDYFPFVFHRWQENLMGFWGRGIAEILFGSQMEINKILRTIQISMHLVCIPKVLIDVSSKIVSAHLDTRIGGLIKHAGKPPIFENMGSVSPELFKHLQWLFDKSFEETGINQLSAQSKLPPGLEAAVAMREYNNIESERFMDIGQRWEKSWMDAAEIVIDMSHDIYLKDKKLKVNVPGKSFIETIDWKEVHLPEDKYVMKCFPINSLSATPAARLEQVTEMIQAGYISKDDGLELLDFPDVKADTNLYLAAKQNILWTIDQMMHKGKYLPPEPYQDLANGIMLMQKSYLCYKMQNAPDARLNLLRRWIQQAESMVNPPQAPGMSAVNGAPPAPGAMPPNPQGAPIAPPQAPAPSPLVPQVQQPQ